MNSKERLLKYLSENDIKQIDLMNTNPNLKKKQSALSNYIQGKTIPRLDLILEISEALPELDLNWWLKGKSPKNSINLPTMPEGLEKFPGLRRMFEAAREEPAIFAYMMETMQKQIELMQHLLEKKAGIKVPELNLDFKMPELVQKEDIEFKKDDLDNK